MVKKVTASFSIAFKPERVCKAIWTTYQWYHMTYIGVVYLQPHRYQNKRSSSSTIITACNKVQKFNTYCEGYSCIYLCQTSLVEARPPPHWKHLPVQTQPLLVLLVARCATNSHVNRGSQVAYLLVHNLRTYCEDYSLFHSLFEPQSSIIMSPIAQPAYI